MTIEYPLTSHNKYIYNCGLYIIFVRNAYLLNAYLAVSHNVAYLWLKARYVYKLLYSTIR